ncbi:MAG TPA: pyruvate ferredoxin oxidoreductase [Firmicutes bacterium]|nr:pyruvate ferredoxin oxidoreductase [Candidatus Fermentithermobacillaceae bacterium]
MKEIRIHGRGGQGSVVLAELIAMAAWNQGKFSQAFPYLGGGGERRGAPVQSFARISDKPIRLRCRVQTPDYVIVQDPALVELVDVTRGLKPNGLVLVNGAVVPAKLLNAGFRVYAVPASEMALKETGRGIPNTPMLGAFARVTGELSLDSVLAAVGQKFSGEIRRINEIAVTVGYNSAPGLGREGE